MSLFPGNQTKESMKILIDKVKRRTDQLRVFLEEDVPAMIERGDDEQLDELQYSLELALEKLEEAKALS